MIKRLALLIILCMSIQQPSAQTLPAKPISIQFWHAMAGPFGQDIKRICQQFNASQQQYRVIPVYKGTYIEALTTMIAAFRAHRAPVLAQVFEVGTATLLRPQGIIVPMYRLLDDTDVHAQFSDFFPAIKAYYSDSEGRLLGLPFNVSSAVMYYNKAAFQQAGIKPPKTWPQLEIAAKNLLAKGYRCGFTSAWPGWIQLEQFSAWHNLPMATGENGFSRTDARLNFANPLIKRQLTKLAQWQQQRIFQYGGRGDDPVSLFTSGKCVMLMESSGSMQALQKLTAFPMGVAALPYWPDVPGAPQNTSIGGGAIWALQGHSQAEYAAARAFIKFLLQDSIQSAWQQASGYMPITKGAHQLSLRQGYYRRFPGAKVALYMLTHKKPTKYSRGLRLGNYVVIRDINDEIIESVVSGEKSVNQALNDGLAMGNFLLERFNTNVSEGGQG